MKTTIMKNHHICCNNYVESSISVMDHCTSPNIYRSTYLPHSEKVSSDMILLLSSSWLQQNYVGEYMSHGPYPELNMIRSPIQDDKVLVSDNILGIDDGNIIVSTDGKILGSTFGYVYRNKIGLDERTHMDSLYGFGMLYGKELGWFVGVSDRSTHLPHLEQASSTSIPLSFYRLHKKYVGEYMSHGPYTPSNVPFQVILVR